MTGGIHHGFEDPYEVPDDYTPEDEIEDFLRYQRWHDSVCSEPHFYAVVDPVRPVVTVDPGEYL